MAILVLCNQATTGMKRIDWTHFLKSLTHVALYFEAYAFFQNLATVYSKTFEGETFTVGIEKDRSQENVRGSSISQ